MQHRTESCSPLYGVSLFSGAGIGDLGFRAAGISFVAMCEVERERAALAALNFPETKQFEGDIWQLADSLATDVERLLCGRELFLISCTAPCQGMSKNGQGTLLNNIRKGKRPRLDPRNRLVLPALAVIRRLKPKWVVFENVLEMRNTVIEDERGELRPILDVISGALSPDYAGQAYDVEFADYGIAQRRQRLITVYTKNEVAAGRYAAGFHLVPPKTHDRFGSTHLERWVSVADALKGFSPLDAIDSRRAESDLRFHRVPVLDPKKYEWVRHTPPGKSAFDNQCVNPSCGYCSNDSHRNERENGINRARKGTPLYCSRCGSLLPRPYTVNPDGSKRIMYGYTSAYKRMDPELPAPAITRNLSFPCSDNKIHPFENRVLSLAEAMTLQTVSDYDYCWGSVSLGENLCATAPDSLIRLVIAESVPPRFLEYLGNHLTCLSASESLPVSLEPTREAKQLSLI